MALLLARLNPETKLVRFLQNVEDGPLSDFSHGTVVKNTADRVFSVRIVPRCIRLFDYNFCLSDADVQLAVLVRKERLFVSLRIPIHR